MNSCNSCWQCLSWQKDVFYSTGFFGELVIEFFEIKSKIETLSCCAINSEHFFQKFAQSVVATQQKPDIKKIDPKGEITCLKPTIGKVGEKYLLTSRQKQTT